METALTVDGAAGGGQIVRTALSLSALTGRSVEITSIRANRDSPGLGHQHLRAIDLLASVTDADVEGASLRSDAVTFRPHGFDPAESTVDIGTAGSIPLLVDAVLPLAVRLSEPWNLTVIGGTDVKWSPTIDYFKHVKTTLLSRFGLGIDVVVVRSGFHPRGGGEVTIRLKPSDMKPIECPKRGSLQRVDIHSKASNDLEAADVAERQATQARTRLEPRLDCPIRTDVGYAEATSIGSSITLVGVYETTRVGFDALGERGKPAEDVANGVVDEFRAFRETPGTVDAHLADQLLPFLGLVGGGYTSPRLTAHLTANRAVLAAFGLDVEVETGGDGANVAAPGTGSLGG